MHREQDRPGAAAPRSLLFRHLDQLAAETPLAQALRQEKAIYEEQPHRRPADQAADDLATMGVAGENGERPLVAVARLREVIAAEPIPDDCLSFRAGRVGERKIRFFLGSHCQTGASPCSMTR